MKFVKLVCFDDRGTQYLFSDEGKEVYVTHENVITFVEQNKPNGIQVQTFNTASGKVEKKLVLEAKAMVTV